MTRGKSFKTLELRDAAYDILEKIQPASVRAVCYKLFTQDLIPNMGKNATGRVSRVLKEAREEDQIPWEWIVDETREAELPCTWDNPSHYAALMQDSFHQDRWQLQSHHVEVWSEKGTIRGTLAPILKEYGVTFRVLHGYSSATTLHDIAEESHYYETRDTPFVALYIGDWDPSGLHMSNADLPQRLADYGGVVEVRRIALCQHDLEDLPSFDLDTKKARFAV